MVKKFLYEINVNLISDKLYQSSLTIFKKKWFRPAYSNPNFLIPIEIG